MGFPRLISGLIATSVAVGLALPATAQSFPSTYPTQSNYAQTTVFQQWTSDMVMNGGNFWALGGYVGIQAATSLNFAAIAPAPSLTQNTIFTLPDPGSGSATIALQGGSNSFTQIVLTGTSFNTTLKSLAALGQAQTITIPDSGTSAANVILSQGTQASAATNTYTGVNTFSAGKVLPTMGTGTATYNPGGRLFSLSATQSSATGAANNTTYTLPANTLTTTGQGIRIKIHGTTAANSNTKACNFLFGGGPVTITLPLSTGSNKDFNADILVYRTGTSTQEISVAGYANAVPIINLSTTASTTETSTAACELNIPISTGAADVVVDEFSIYAEQ